MSDQHVILIGASARAAATSARRAGWKPWCADLYADADLQRVATVRKVSLEAYPQALFDALADAPRAAVMYTGALENRPDLIATLDRPLWGNPPEVLRAIRSPERWTQYLRANHVPCPLVADQARAEGHWVLKPRKSAGGLGIRAYAGQAFNPRTHFLQERIDGAPCSAIFLGAQLIGVTRQLVGEPWLNATGYQYCGNIGPLPIAPDVAARWQQLGAVLAEFPLRGLFGVDAIERDGVPCPVEINPRYTASMELLERSLGQAFLPAHRAAFEQTLARPSFPSSAWEREPRPTIWGKAILYARQALVFPATGPWLAALEEDVDLDRVEFADIPHVGEVIGPGQPVLTLFASSATVSECEMKLREKAEAIDRRLWG